MEKLNFVVTWGEDKTRAWSGTYYSIHQALEKYYDIADFDTIEPNCFANVYAKILLKLGLRKDDFNVRYILKNRKHYENRLSGKIFQFTEFIQDRPSRQTYIYQDLSVPYLYYLARTNSRELIYSGFDSVDSKAMKRRCNLQMDYYRSAAGILYMGRWMTEFMRREYPQLNDKIHHVGAGINLDYKKIRPSTEKRNNRILFVGRDFKRKGGEKVIEAFKLLKGKVPDLELHVAGPSVDPMQTPTDGYHFYGDISYDKVQELMNMCDLFCMPSYFEAYGLVFIEALVFGLPCIGRNCCEMPYFIEEGITGELVDTDDASELAGKISKILQNEDYRRNVVQRRDSYIKEYSWDAVASRMANIIG